MMIASRHYRQVWLCLIISWSTFAYGQLANMLINTDAKAMSFYRQGQMRQAAETFQDPSWKAMAYYRALDFKNAIAIWIKQNKPHAWFNAGNAAAHLKDWQHAILYYQQALSMDGSFKAAQINKQWACQHAPDAIAKGPLCQPVKHPSSKSVKQHNDQHSPSSSKPGLQGQGRMNTSSHRQAFRKQDKQSKQTHQDPSQPSEQSKSHASEHDSNKKVTKTSPANHDANRSAKQDQQEPSRSQLKRFLGRVPVSGIDYLKRKLQRDNDRAIMEGR